jgi:PAS domain S-box-containing protein
MDARSAAPTSAFFEATTDVIARFDRDLRVVYANPALARATALPRRAFVGRRLSEVEGFASYAPLWESGVAAVFETQEERWFKFSFAHPVGPRQFDVRLMLEMDASGQTAHVTSLWRDVTVPRQALRASRQAGDFVEQLLAAAPIGMYVLDRDLRYQAWNEALEQMFGLSAEEVIGHRPDELDAFSAQRDRPSLIAGLQRLRDGTRREAQRVEYEFTGRRHIWVREQRTPVFGARGEFRGAFVTVEPIDRERFAATSLAALRQALDLAGEMVLEIRRDGAIVDANETARAWLGYSREELTGRRLPAIDVALVPERFDAMMRELSERGAWRGEGRYRTRAGTEFAADVVLQRVEVGDGNQAREFIFLLARDVSDRKRVQTELADSAARFRTIFEDSPVAHLVLDSGLRIVQTNAAACALLGYSAAELVGHEPTLLLHPKDKGVVQRLHERLADGGAFVEDNRRLRHRDGHTVWGRLSVRAWESADRQHHYLLVIEDFTERKTSEDQLQVMLRDHQTLLETMSVGVAQAVKGRVLIANREFARMFGYGDDEVVGMSLWDLAADHANRMPQEVTGLPAVRPWQTTSAEVVLFRRDGEPVWCLVQARAVQPADARETGARIAEAIYTFQDISESKRQREALTRSLLELNVVFDTTAVAVLHLADERVIRGNAQAVQMFGGDERAERELVGRRFASLFADEHDYSIHGTVMRAPLAAGDMYSFETQLRGRDKRPFWALVSVRAVEPANPGAGQIASILDISSRKQQEEQLQTLLTESQLLFDTALVGLLFVREGRPVRANSAMEALLACEPGTLTNQIPLFAHPTEQLLFAGLAAHYEEINSKGTCEFEMHLYRRKGPPRWVAVQGRAIDRERPQAGYVFAFLDIDARKRSERELRAALGELQLIFDNALVGMAYVADELIVKANAATERMFDYPAADLRELQIASLFDDPEDWTAVRSQAPAAGAGGVSFEHLLRRADGSTFWCAGNVRLLDSTAPERGLIIALMDVDQRRRSEEELLRVRNYLDLVVENLPVLVSVRAAEDGRFVSLNRAGEQITGLARDQVVGRTWYELYGRQFADLYAELDRRALTGGTQVDRPRDVMLRADGRTLTVHQRVVPLFERMPGGQSRARYVMSIVDDLTEEVRAEAALRETETRFRQFAENIDQLVFIGTADLSAVLYVNPRYTAVVGGPADELLDNPRAALARVHPGDATAVERLLPRLVARCRRLRKTEFSVRIDHPARGPRLLHVRLNPVRMFDGSVRVFGVADDVTERVEAEKQRIEEAVKQRDILVREVHHRIKNNLQGVAGLLQHQATAKPELAVTLNEIAGQIQAIAQVHGLQIRATGTLPVLGVVQGIFQNLASMFGVQVRFEPPPPALWRWGLPENEAVPLALVVNELGTNAIKYRASRDLAITVRVVPRPDGLELRLENTGQLKAGFDLGAIASSVSGLGLVKALLPRRGARLAVEQHGATVVARLDLMPPAIGEDMG